MPYFKGEVMAHLLEAHLIKHQNNIINFEKFLYSHKSQGVILSYTDSPSCHATFQRTFFRYRKVPLIYNNFSQNHFYKMKFQTAYKGYWLTIKITRISVESHRKHFPSTKQLNRSISTKFIRSFSLFNHIRNHQDLFCTDRILVSLRYFNKLQPHDTAHHMNCHDVTSLLMLIPALV